MRSNASADRLTVIAIAFIAYAGANVCHEIVGHCATAALMGNGCRQLSTTNIPLARAITEMPAWRYNVVLVAGSAANWAAGLVCLRLSRALRTARPGLRYFLWLFMSVSLLLPSGYMTAAPVIEYGDAYYLVMNLPGQLVWRGALVLAGAGLCLLSFRLCLRELKRLLGAGGARSSAWRLVVPAYVAGGVLVVTSGLFSQLDFKWAQLQTAGGTFGLTAWLLLTPLLIPKAPAGGGQAFALPRSRAWVVAGALCALVFVGVLGPGLPL